MKAKTKAAIIIILLFLIIGGSYYYAALPPINIHSPGFWGFIIVLSVVITVLVGLYSLRNHKKDKSEIKLLFRKNFLFNVSSCYCIFSGYIFIIRYYQRTQIQRTH